MYGCGLVGRFDDFDDAIDEAIEEDVGDVYGGGEISAIANQHK